MGIKNHLTYLMDHHQELIILFRAFFSRSIKDSIDSLVNESDDLVNCIDNSALKRIRMVGCVTDDD